MHRDFLKLNPKGLIHLDSKNTKKKKNSLNNYYHNKK